MNYWRKLLLAIRWQWQLKTIKTGWKKELGIMWDTISCFVLGAVGALVGALGVFVAMGSMVAFPIKHLILSPIYCAFKFTDKEMEVVKGILDDDPMVLRGNQEVAAQMIQRAKK